MYRVQVLGFRCLRDTASFSWNNRVNSAMVSNRVPDKSAKSVGGLADLYELRCSRQTLSSPNHRLPRSMTSTSVKAD